MYTLKSAFFKNTSIFPIQIILVNILTRAFKFMIRRMEIKTFFPRKMKDVYLSS